MAPKLHFDDSNVFVVREKKQLSRNRAMPWTNIMKTKHKKPNEINWKEQKTLKPYTENGESSIRS